MAPRLDAGIDKGVTGDSDHGFWYGDVSGWGVDGLRTAGDKVAAGLAVLGDIFAMLCHAVWSTVGTIVHRRFSWSEFAEQSWFLVSVTILPTVLIAIPFGLVLVSAGMGSLTRGRAVEWCCPVEHVGAARGRPPENCTKEGEP